MVLAAHGASRRAVAQDSVVAQAAALSAATGAAVRAGFLIAEPPVAQAAASVPGDGPLVVLPMFMTDGYLVRHALPKAVGGPARVLTPFGLAPGLAELILAQAEQAARAAGLEPARCTLLLVGHGSLQGGGPARDAVTGQAARAAAAGRFAAVEVAFLEEPPEVGAQLRRCAGDLVVVGFFATPGGHAGEDVPRLLADDPRAGTRRVLYTGAIGTHPDAVALLAGVLRAEAG